MPVIWERAMHRLLLGRNFKVTAPKGWTRYIDRFVASYDTVIEPPRGDEVSVVVRPSSRQNWCQTGAKVAFHRSSNYAHWNIDGYATESGICMNEHEVEVRVGAQSIEVEFGQSVSARAPEILFHVVRNYCLYNKKSSEIAMFHASAVSRDGGAILFAGGKGAGKSTQFIEAVTAGGYEPLANDRVVVEENGSQLSVTSWPSYLSYCEGTILDYPVLKDAFDCYEGDEHNWWARKWGPEYSRSYNQDKKRIIPQDYLTKALGRPYKLESHLKAIVISEMDTEYSSGFSVRRGDFEDPGTLEQLIEEIMFSGEDADIPCWHGVSRNTRDESVATIVERMRLAGVRIYRTRMNPLTDKASFRAMLDAI